VPPEQSQSAISACCVCCVLCVVCCIIAILPLPQYSTRPPAASGLAPLSLSLSLLASSHSHSVPLDELRAVSSEQ
jgi:hypothetical protein